MGKKAVILMPDTLNILKTLGEQIKYARLRRKISVSMVAERAGVCRATVWSVENGDPKVAMGIYAAVLHAISGMDKELLLVAKDDILGRALQDANIKTHKRAPKS